MLAEPRPQIVGVENRLPEGRGREALARALRALSGVTRRTAGSWCSPRERCSTHRRRPACGARVRARARRLLTAGEPQDFVGPFVLEKRHPLLLGVTLAAWCGRVRCRCVSAVHPLVSPGISRLIGTPWRPPR